MAANISPIFPLVPNISWISGTAAAAGTPGIAANTTTDLTSGTIYGPMSTGGTNGTRVDFLRFRPLGSTAATVVRIWINNGSVTTTAANNVLFFERTMPVFTVSQVAELADMIVPMNVSIPTGYRIYLTFGTAVAAGFHVTAVSGDY